MSERSYFTRGVFPILSGSLLWALGYFLRKIALRDASPLSLTLLTSVIATVFLWGVLKPQPQELWRLFREHWLKFIGLSLSGVVLGATFMYVALDHLDLGIVTLLEKLQPLFTVIIARALLTEHYSAKMFPYFGLAIVGSGFICIPDPANILIAKMDLYGVCAVIGAALFFAISAVLGKSLMNAGVAPP